MTRSYPSKHLAEVESVQALEFLSPLFHNYHRCWVVSPTYNYKYFINVKSIPFITITTLPNVLVVILDRISHQDDWFGFEAKNALQVSHFSWREGCGHGQTR